MREAIDFAVICFLTIAISGCATVTTGQYQRVSVDSYPQEANVKISSGYRGVTPCSFDLKRNKDHVINISKNGYMTAQVTLRKTLCGSTAGNLIIGGVIGLGVDAMTGACFKLIPENVYVELIPGKEEEIVVIEPPKHKKEEPKKEKEGTEVTINQ
ncbi:MAG: PEGA domain-containing protein [Proteobacteria bacterium]|nr:PEGA domain-containing protein [Pseudomonadota bacterium]